MTSQDVRVLHRERVGTRSPLLDRHDLRRRMPGRPPAAKGSLGRPQLFERYRVDQDEHVIVGPAGNVLAAGARAIEEHGGQPALPDVLQLLHENVERRLGVSLCRHVESYQLEPPPPPPILPPPPNPP